MAGLKLTEEHRQALLGLMPFTQNGTIEYTPKAFEKLDIPKNKKPVFKMRAYNKDEMNRIKKMLSDIQKNENADFNNDVREFSRLSIVGWKNMFDLSTGEEMEFKKSADGSIQKEQYELVPEFIVADLYKHACVVSGLMPKEIEGLES